MVCSIDDDQTLQLRPKHKTDSYKAPAAFDASAQTAESSGCVLHTCFGNAHAVSALRLHYSTVQDNTLKLFIAINSADKFRVLVHEASAT